MYKVGDSIMQSMQFDMPVKSMSIDTIRHGLYDVSIVFLDLMKSEDGERLRITFTGFKEGQKVSFPVVLNETDVNPFVDKILRARDNNAPSVIFKPLVDADICLYGNHWHWGYLANKLVKFIG